jgi:hypothetical protein
MSHLAASALLALAPSAGQNSATTRRICPLSLSLSLSLSLLGAWRWRSWGQFEVGDRCAAADAGCGPCAMWDHAVGERET